jgi:hypothetical protein
LLAQQIAQSRGCGEEECIADPFTRPDRFLQVSDNREGCFDAIFIDLAGVETIEVSFPVESEDVGGICTGQSNEFA